MPDNNNRLMLEIEKERRELNRSIVNPMIPELSIDDLKPVLQMTANARGRYLKAFFDLSAEVGDEPPSSEQIAKLCSLRETYQELVEAARAMEAAIQRDYLDVKVRAKK